MVCVRKLSSITIHGHADSTKLMVQWETAAGNGTVSSLGRWPLPSNAPQLRFTLAGGVELYAFWLKHRVKRGSSGGRTWIRSWVGPYGRRPY